MKHHYYTDEEKAWLTKQDAGLTYKQIKDAFNAEFGSDRNESQISDLMSKRMKIKRTPKGQFKKGAKPKHEIGSEIVKAGYIWVKVNNEYFEGTMSNSDYGKNWKRKADVVWEKENGAIPKGFFLVFLDGDTMNCEIGNLYLVNRKVHARMCQNGWYSGNPEFTRGALKLCELMVTIKEVTEGMK